MKVQLSDVMEGMKEGLTTKELAAKYGVQESTIRNRKRQLAAQGFSPEHDMEKMTPEGFMVKGTSTLYGKDGKKKLQWVKTKMSQDEISILYKEMVAGITEEIVRVKDTGFKTSVNELCNLYIITDYHLGMLAWGEESGEDWDLKIAEDLLISWFDSAVNMSPNAGSCVINVLGDFLHTDGLTPVTPASGHVLDADSRYQKTVRVAIKLLRFMIGRAMESHEQVYVVMAQGNHDESGAIWMTELLHELYADQPRVTVERNPDPYYCYEFGKTSLFFTHGHKANFARVESTMISKYREVFGRTQYSYCHLGHFHHHKSIESSNMIVEQHRTLAAKDAYASRGGWMSGRSAYVITYHKSYGEVSRVSISPEMLKH